MKTRAQTNYIIIHCAYTKPSQKFTYDDVRRWHMQDRGWEDIGYHYVIERDGRIVRGRAEDVQGAHAAGQNADSIGICLMGGMSEEGKTECNFTSAQWHNMEILVSRLKKTYPEAIVIGHNDVSSKDCPCFNAKAWGATL